MQTTYKYVCFFRPIHHLLSIINSFKKNSRIILIIHPSSTACKLCKLFDSSLSFILHINAITKSANYHIFRIKKKTKINYCISY